MCAPGDAPRCRVATPRRELDRGVPSPHMTDPSSPAEFVGREPDERLLPADLVTLPGAGGRPEAAVPSRSRGRIVGTGATLTAASLVIGSLLVLLGLVDAVSSGIDGLSNALVVVGAILVVTHWGWV